MITRTLDDLERLGRIRFPANRTFRSARFLTAADGLGFSYNENRVQAGTVLDVWLKHHWEANVILSGTGIVTDLASGAQWPLSAGTLYVVGPNDRHRLEFTQDECHVSIFNPPLTGEERFDADGSYEPSGPIPKTDRRMFVRCLEDGSGNGQDHGSGDARSKAVPLLTEEDGVGLLLSYEHLSGGIELTVTGGQAIHVVSGEGEVIGVDGGARRLGPSTVYAPDAVAPGTLRALNRMHLLRMEVTPLARRSAMIESAR